MPYQSDWVNEDYNFAGLSTSQRILVEKMFSCDIFALSAYLMAVEAEIANLEACPEADQHWLALNILKKWRLWAEDKIALYRRQADKIADLRETMRLTEDAVELSTGQKGRPVLEERP